MTHCTTRRFAFIEEWEPGIKVEIIMTGKIGDEQLQAIEGFVARQHRRVVGTDDLEGVKWMATIHIAERDDGGMRVWSDDIKGLILSGPDAEKVGASIMAAIKGLREYAAT